MILTNHQNLPETLFNAVKADDYDSGGSDYTASQLIKPPRIVLLEKRHFDEIEEDASDRIWLLMGKSIHSILENSGADNSFIEERIHAEVLGRKISGLSDLYRDETIDDYKVTSAWTAVFGSRTKEWTEQLNIYAWLFEGENFKVRELRVIAIYRDWSASKALAGNGYPQASVEVIPITLWFHLDAGEFIRDRVQTLIDSERLADDDLPPCSTEEMWEKPTKYAVMKEGRKSALRVLDTEDEAMEYVAKNEVGYIVKRPGERTRCQQYCSCSNFCNIFQEYKETKND